MKNYNGELGHVSEWLNATLSKMLNKNNRQTCRKGHRGTQKDYAKYLGVLIEKMLS